MRMGVEFGGDSWRYGGGYFVCVNLVVDLFHFGFRYKYNKWWWRRSNRVGVSIGASVEESLVKYESDVEGIPWNTFQGLIPNA